MKRTETVDHRMRMALLDVVHRIGELRTLVALPNLGDADRKYYERQLDVAQRAVHAMQERMEACPPGEATN